MSSVSSYLLKSGSKNILNYVCGSHHSLLNSPVLEYVSGHMCHGKKKRDDEKRTPSVEGRKDVDYKCVG